MQLKLPKATLHFMLGSMLLMTIATSCNDTSSTKETKTDSAAVVTDTNKIDTNKMDTAKTRPIVPPDQPAK